MPKNDDQIAPIRGGTYYPAPDELDPNVEINLNSLRDAPGGGKPLYSYGTLIRYAIKGSPEGRLLLEEIYYAIEQRYPYFKTAPPGWKNSVRHNLSLNACFEKVPRPLTDRGKGSYWTVNDSIDPKQGIHRVRSRRRKNDKGGSPTPASAPYPPPFPGYGGAEGGPYDTYAAMYPYGYDPSMYPPPFMPPGGAPDMTGASMPGFEGAEAGMGGDNDVDWRNLFVQELERLKSMTKEQDKNGAPQEWYRMMLMRLKMGMYGVPPFGAPIPPHPDAGRGPEAQHAQQQAQQQQHSRGDEEHEAEDEEDE